MFLSTSHLDSLDTIEPDMLILHLQTISFEQVLCLSNALQFNGTEKAKKLAEKLAKVLSKTDPIKTGVPFPKTPIDIYTSWKKISEPNSPIVSELNSHVEKVLARMESLKTSYTQFIQAPKSDHGLTTLKEETYKAYQYFLEQPIETIARNHTPHLASIKDLNLRKKKLLKNNFYLLC